MTKQMEITFGLVILIGVLVAFLFGIWWSYSPTVDEVKAKWPVKEGIKMVNKDILSSDVAKEIGTLEKNGEVPVIVSPGDVGRTNPFSPF